MVSSLKHFAGILTCLLVLQVTAPAQADTNRAAAIEAYNRANLTAVEWFNDLYKSALASCKDCDANAGRRAQLERESAQLAAFKIYHGALCAEGLLGSRNGSSPKTGQEFGKCYQERSRITLISLDLLREYMRVSRNYALRCLADSRLPEDDIDFPVHPRLARLIGDGMPVKHYDHEKLLRCLRS